MHGKTTKVFAKYQKLLSWLAPNAFLTLFEAPGSQMPKVLQPKFITFCPWSKPLRSVLVGVSSTQLSRLETFETVSVECHGDDTPLTFHDTHLSSLLILLVHVSKFNIYDTPITLSISINVSWALNLLTWQNHYEERGCRVMEYMREVSSPWHSSGSVT